MRSAHNVHTVRDLEELRATRDEWNDVVNAAAVQSPHALWEWVYPWSQVYAGDGSLRCIMVRDADGRAVGLAPLCISQQTNRWLRKGDLTFTGGYGPAWSAGLEIVARRGQEEAVIASVLKEIGEWSADRPAVSLLRMKARARTIAVLVTRAAELGLACHMERFGHAVAGGLPKDMRSFDEQMPSSSKCKQLRRSRERLLEDFSSVEFVDCEDSGEVEQWCELMRRMDVVSRSRRNMRKSNFMDPLWLRCLTQSSRMLHEIGVMRLKRLEIDGQPAAVWLHAILGQTLYLVQSAYDCAFSRWQVGQVLLRECIAEAIGQGVTRLDFSSGEHPYKTKFHSGREYLVNVHFLPNRVSFSAASLATRFLCTGLRKTIKGFLPTR